MIHLGLYHEKIADVVGADPGLLGEAYSGEHTRRIRHSLIRKKKHYRIQNGAALQLFMCVPNTDCRAHKE